MSDSVNGAHPPVRFRLLDKASGQCVGILSFMHGQNVPNLSTVELCKIDNSVEPVYEDKTVVNPKDINANNVCLSLERMVDIFVRQLEKNSHFGSEFQRDVLKAKLEKLVLEEITLSKVNMKQIVHNKVKKIAETVKTDTSLKPFKLGWLRRVALNYSIGGNVTSVRLIQDVWYVTPPDKTNGRRQELRGREEIKNYLEETRNTSLTVADFRTEKVVLGLPTGCESAIRLKEGSDSSEDFTKPFSQGWLRTVAIRKSDYKVTAVSYYTPPDCEGTRLRLCYKRDIADYLERTDAKDIEVDDFVISRKVIGMSATYEQIKYTGNQCISLSEYTNDKGDKFSKGKHAQPFIDKDSSFDTIVGSSTESCSDSSSDSDSSDSDGSSSDSSDLEPNIVNIMDEEDPDTLAPVEEFTNITDGSAESTVSNHEQDRTPIATSLPTTLSRASRNEDPDPLPIPQCTMPMPMVTVRMVSSRSGSRGGVVKRMMIKRGVKIGKGMQMFAKKFGQDLRFLKFYVENRQLTGEELAGTLDEASITVEGMH